MLQLNVTQNAISNLAKGSLEDYSIATGPAHHVEYANDYRTTCIIGCVSAEYEYCRKWVGLSVGTTDPSRFEVKFGDSLLLGSGTIASQSSVSDEGMIGQIDVSSDDTPRFFSEGTFSTFSGSLMIPLPQAHFLSPWLIRALGNITEC